MPDLFRVSRYAATKPRGIRPAIASLPARNEPAVKSAALADVISPEDIAAAAWWLGVGAAKTTGELLLVDAGLKITKA